MFPKAIRLFTIRDVEVRADPTWLVIVVLVLASFVSRFQGGFGTTAAAAMATTAALGFFASLVVHELGHALEARHRGIEVTGVTLFLLGGVTEMHGEAQKPRDEFAVAAVGPFLSLVLGALFGVATTTVSFWSPAPAVEMVLGTLGWLNVGLAVFNLVPGAPLDGGRVLRAGLWAVLGDRQRAIAWSARAGQAFALALWALAIRVLLLGIVSDALWLAFVGWFLWQAAGMERRQVALVRLLQGRRAGALDVEVVAPVDVDDNVAMLVDLADADGAVATPARPVDRHGEVVGALVMDDVRGMHPQDRVFRCAADVMRPADDLPRVGPETGVWELLQTFQRHPLVLLQLDDGRTTTLTSRQFAVAVEALRRPRVASATTSRGPA